MVSSIEVQRIVGFKVVGKVKDQEHLELDHVALSLNCFKNFLLGLVDYVVFSIFPTTGNHVILSHSY